MLARLEGRVGYVDQVNALSRTLGCVMAGMLVAACSAGSPAAESNAEDPVDDLVFEFTRIAPHGFIDQALEINNLGGGALAPTVRIKALGADGKVLDDVDVSTAYGSDGGLVVVPPFGSALDFLQFEPRERIGEVADVAVSVVNVRELPDVGLGELRELPEVQPIAQNGAEVDKFGAFAFVDVQNPNPNPVTVRVVFLIYGDTAPGEPQQAELVLPVTGPTEIQANSSDRKPVLPEFAERSIDPDAAVSLKAYLSVP